MSFHFVLSVGFQNEQLFAFETGLAEVGDYTIAFSFFGISVTVGVLL